MARKAQSASVIEGGVASKQLRFFVWRDSYEPSESYLKACREEAAGIALGSPSSDCASGSSGSSDCRSRPSRCAHAGCASD